MSRLGLCVVLISGFVSDLLALRITPTTGCGGVFNEMQGRIFSQNYPRNYTTNTDCGWLISVPASHTVSITFLDFDVEHHSSCFFDFVTLYDGSNSYAPLMAKLCGSTLTAPATFSSSSNHLYVRMHSDSVIATIGFMAKYNSTRKCGGTLTGTQGSFTSPNYPQPFLHGANCVWAISVPSGFHIQLDIHDFHVEAHADCNYDAFEVYGGGNDMAPRLARLCHSQNTTQTLTSSGNTMMVRFTSDGSIADTGFSASFKAITGVLGGDLRGTAGSFTSPNYPLPYPAGAVSVWTVTVPTGLYVKLTIEHIALESSINCISSVLEVFDGPDALGPRLARLCHRQTTPTVFTSSENTMFVRFFSDHSGPGLAFSASYQAVSDPAP